MNIDLSNNPERNHTEEIFSLRNIESAKKKNVSILNVHKDTT